MELSKQVTSLELSKRLKEVGVKHQSWFFWVNLRDKNAETTWELVYANDKRLQKPDMYEWYNAYTVAELLDILPRSCPQHGGVLLICPAFSDKNWFVGYGDHMNAMGCHVESGSITESCGLMLEYLIKNNLLTV